MAVELTVPALGESITEAVVGKWHKKVGETVKLDEPVVVLETDKVTIDVAAPAAGALAALLPALALYGFTVDDALIPARYAAHLARGLGYRFNALGSITDGVNTNAIASSTPSTTISSVKMRSANRSAMTPPLWLRMRA